MNSKHSPFPWLLILILLTAGCRRGGVVQRKVVAEIPKRGALPTERPPTATLGPTLPASTPTWVPASDTPVPAATVEAPVSTSDGSLGGTEKIAEGMDGRQRPFLLFGRDVPLLGNTGVQPDTCRVVAITMLGSGHAPDWSWDGQWIAYQDRVNDSYEIFIMDAEGSDSRCLTCDGIPPQFNGKHKGKAAFHPGGRYLLFSVENEHGDHGVTTLPGIGNNHDLWVADLETGAYSRLTRVPEDAAIQYPRFSADGSRLLWSQRYRKARLSILRRGRELGLWTMRLAEFVTTRDGPVLGETVDLEPGGQGYYEPHGFSPDGTRIIFTGMIRPEKSAFYGEIYTMDLATSELNLVAQSDSVHYEMALYSPDGRRISFMSGAFMGVLEYGLYRTDLYLMDADGSDRVRLTFFNEPGDPHYVGAPVQIQKEAWSPDGTRIISAYLNHETRKSQLFMITFGGPCGRS